MDHSSALCHLEFWSHIFQSLVAFNLHSSCSDKTCIVSILQHTLPIPMCYAFTLHRPLLVCACPVLLPVFKAGCTFTKT